MLFALSLRHSQARATSLPEGGIGAACLWWAGLAMWVPNTDRRGRRSLQWWLAFVWACPVNGKHPFAFLLHSAFSVTFHIGESVYLCNLPFFYYFIFLLLT